VQRHLGEVDVGALVGLVARADADQVLDRRAQHRVDHVAADLERHRRGVGVAGLGPARGAVVVLERAADRRRADELDHPEIAQHAHVVADVLGADPEPAGDARRRAGARVDHAEDLPAQRVRERLDQVRVGVGVAGLRLRGVLDLGHAEESRPRSRLRARWSVTLTVPSGIPNR